MSSGVQPRVRAAFFRIAIALSIHDRLTTTHAEKVWSFLGLVARPVVGRGQASHPHAQPRAQGRAASTYSSRRPSKPMCVRPGCAGANPATVRSRLCDATVLAERRRRLCQRHDVLTLATPCCGPTRPSPQHGDPCQSARALSRSRRVDDVDMRPDGGGVRTGKPGAVASNCTPTVVLAD